MYPESLSSLLFAAIAVGSLEIRMICIREKMFCSAVGVTFTQRKAEVFGNRWATSIIFRK